jgi:protein phosphatase
MKDAIMVANELVLKHQENSTRTEKMGSTLIMALVADHQAHIVNVGDSRAYHLNAERIEQISVDHSLVERLIQIGQITREEARTHDKKNVVYSIIGEKRKLEIGYYHVPLLPGERLLLCSDGLNTMVPDEELLALSKSYSELTKASQMMIEAAKQAGGLDNITTILIQMNQ